MLKSDLERWTTRLSQDLDNFQPTAAAMPLQQIENAVTGFDGTKTVEQKKTIRNNLWELRKQLEAAGPVPQPLKESYEKVRNLSLDNSWERQLNGFPSGTYNISPRASDLPNFQMINPQFLRAGQADPDGMQWLMDYGVKTEVDLRGDDRDNQWNPPAWAPETVVQINVPDFGNPEFAQVEKFIDTVDNPVNQPVYVHCKAGIGRTGLMTACWRVSHGLTADQALAYENINSYAGNLKQEKFVREFETYWQKKHFVLDGSRETGVGKKRSLCGNLDGTLDFDSLLPSPVSVRRVRRGW